MLQRVCRRKPGQSFRQSFGLIIDRVWGEGQDEIFGLRGDPLLVNANEKLDGRPSGFGHLGLRFERGYAKTAKSRQSRKTSNEEPFSDANDIDMDQFQGLMVKAVAHLQHELANIRTGRATTGMLDHLKVDAYGNKVPFKAIGTVAVRESHVLAVMLFDQQLANAAMSAISNSPLQLNPRMEGEEILIPVPPPTKETIESMRKLCKAEGESAKVTVRHARKLALDALKSVSSDDKKRRAEKEVQTLTDKFIAEIDGIVASKQKDIERHTS